MIPIAPADFSVSNEMALRIFQVVLEVANKLLTIVSVQEVVSNGWHSLEI